MARWLQDALVTWGCMWATSGRTMERSASSEEKWESNSATLESGSLVRLETDQER
jgi:hypothetical protein